MTINKDYNAGDDEEWDMVPDGGDDAPPPAATTTATTTEIAPSLPEPAAPATEEEEEPPAAPPMPLPSAPPEEEVTGLAELQAKLGITDETSPEEIQKMMNESITNESVPNEASNMDKAETKEDTPLLSREETPSSSNSSNSNANETENTTPEQNSKVPAWLRASFGAATKVLQDVEQKHDLKQKTRQGLDTVGSSLRQVGSTIQKETVGIRSAVESESYRLSQVVQHKVEELDVKGKAKSATETIHRSAKSVSDGVQHKVEELDVKGKAKSATETISKGAKTAGDTISKGAKTAGEKAKEMNKDGKVTQFVAAAAVVGASIFLASKGKPGAGAAVMGTAGAAFMAGEAARSGRRHDEGLNEDLHMD